MNETSELAKNASRLVYEDLPSEVTEKIKLLLLDQLGCQIAFSTLPWGKQVYRYTLAKRSHGASTLTYYGEKVNPEDAAFCNAVFGHGFEMDDVEMKTTSHPAVCVIPSALALGEDREINGQELITAIVSGYETMLRFCYAADSMRDNFFHASSIAGAFGSAAAAGTILGFDHETMLNAFGIASTQASGNTEYSCSGGTVKRTLGALGSFAGLRSALLAQAGITGSEQAFEGKKGFMRGICDGEPLFDELLVPFIDNWKTLEVGFKPYCCCAAQHTVIDAAEKIRAKNIDTDDIDSIEILQLAREVSNVGKIEMPQDIITAQFCGRFACAQRLVNGSNGFFDYNMDNINDPRIISLIKKTTYEEDDPRTVLKEGNGPARVTVRMKDGSEISETVYYAIGTTQNPMSHDDVIAKFMGLVSKSIPESKAKQIIETVEGLENLSSLKTLTNLLSSEGGK